MESRITILQKRATKPSKLQLTKQPCPKCPSSDAYHEWDDGHGYCFSCKTYFSGKKAELDHSFTYEYVPHRGLHKSTLEKYDVKAKIDSEGRPISLGYPYADGSYKVRSLLSKDFYWENNGTESSKRGLFGRNRFAAGSHKYVTITEGETDALSLYQVLLSPVVSVQSASSALRDCTVDRSWLDSFERVYLAFDDDAAGRDAARAVAKLFDYNKVYDVRFRPRKDANDYLTAGADTELKNIWWNAKKYLPEIIVSSYEDFRKALEVQPKLGVPYPFRKLTEMTYGIRTSETVLLKAQEKVGKTELVHFILHKYLKETDDAVAGIFLEEPKARTLQSLAGIELGKQVHLPDSGVGTDEIINAVEKVVGRDDRLHLYSHFGSDDPNVLLDTIRFLVSARGCRLVCFDHITMSVSGLAGEDERRALDYLSTRLEMMVKELDFALLMVSHVNDEGKTRGSRYLTKVADITIDASRDTLADNPDERNTVKLTIPYNRYCGKTGPAGDLLFVPETYSFKEREYVPANDNSRRDSFLGVA